MDRPCAAQKEYEDLDDPVLDKTVSNAMKEFPVPGMAVLVLDNGEIRAKGYGYSDVEHKIPVTPRTLFFTGSTTKSFTAAAAALLAESRDFPSVTWRTPMARLLGEDWMLDQTTSHGKHATSHVTIEDCLSHRTGLPRHDLTWYNARVSNLDIVRSLRELPMHNELRTEFEYCNNGYTAVMCAVERAMDRPFKDLLKEQIFEPLQMQCTACDLADAQQVAAQHPGVDLARGYLWDVPTGSHVKVPWEDLPPFTGAGGIISNVVDYSSWMKHLMTPTDLTTAISSNTVKQMRIPRSLVPAQAKQPFTGPQGYGLGLYMQVYRGREVLQHRGAIVSCVLSGDPKGVRMPNVRAQAGYMANMTMLPPTPDEREADGANSGWAVVTLVNGYSLAQDIVAWHLLDEYLATPKQECYDTTSRYREAQREKEDSMEPLKVVERLYGKDASSVQLDPRLPLESYTGVYRHPAYHEFQVTLPPSHGKESDDEKRSEIGLTLCMAPPTNAEAYLAISATLHHVSGDYWWAHQRMGPSSWITDVALKLEFMIGPTGRVDGMRYQAEPSMPDTLAFFEKIS